MGEKKGLNGTELMNLCPVSLRLGIAFKNSTNVSAHVIMLIKEKNFCP